MPPTITAMRRTLVQILLLQGKDMRLHSRRKLLTFVELLFALLCLPLLILIAIKVGGGIRDPVQCFAHDRVVSI